MAAKDSTERNQKKSYKSNNSNDHHRKRGRQELRTIRRSAAKKSRYDSNVTEHNDTEELLQEESEEGEEDEEDDQSEQEEVDEDERKGKVYGALLTILETEHPEPKHKRQPKEKLLKEQVSDSNLNNTGDRETEDSIIEEDETEQIENGLLDRDDEQSDDDQLNDSNDVESDDEQDPFESHFNKPTEQFVDKLHAAFESREIKYKATKIVIDDSHSVISSKPTIFGEELETNRLSSSKHGQSIFSYFIKQRLKIQNNLLNPKVDPLTPLQKELLDPMFQYKDILYEYDSYGKDEDEYRDLYALHALNHVYKTRDRILKNNQRLQDNTDTEYLDQGFTRPKVLIVVPTRDTAYEVTDKIIKKSGLDQVDKKGKFYDQFKDDSLPPSSKPKSFQQIFKGNTNDFFVLGLKFTRKAIKLYSNFYQSDIIVCSPLGMQMIVENTDKKKRQDDFLSSIELLIVDQLHSLEYQNLAHIFTIFDHLNKIPTEQHDADFSRIRMWYINDQAKLFRQTMVFTKYVSPAANAIINNRCRNWEGRWKNHKIVAPEVSSIGKLGLKIKQIFQRFDIMGGSIVDEPDYRFKHFTSVIIPSIVKSTSYDDGILIYIPDYTDYVRIRNYLKEKTRILFGDINEYSEQRELNSNRSLLQQGRVKVLLYTERLHHYRRYEIKGVKSVVFYKPPTNPEFYNEVVRFIGKNAFLGNTDLNISTVRTVYCKLDGLSLERIVGTKRAGILCHAQNEVYEFK
ncbi:rRNA-binding ribosome biosynthesis protein UTP25 NDAI_0B03530 [Naumovozyma dairenensis CBS 421]|uniref:U3 small nucleolar RNA-associated protein 25 n=1 Tax=Naumovozyma dairenensis (strain ATCC 10597 / BCRC 20456 / CBS 421 / NBRC 0211 / NRRL Y-12639) TaxID=1071378 RepID=G0W6H6_NAUDC|nr:hypothetical protein NDAI_0B03530 [Naumovozyma dairenensis CBS 421]CCD23387.1 hypothetical protein NDAI_0B03530 [Naumovozyma dairenensis CBS 421]